MRLPRTGTTILHDILAQNPANRVPMTWEAMFPSPPPEAVTFDTDPGIEVCEVLFPDIDAQIPGFKAMHPMAENQIPPHLQWLSSALLCSMSVDLYIPSSNSRGSWARRRIYPSTAQVGATVGKTS